MPLFLLLTFSLMGAYATGPETIPYYVVGNAMVLVAINGINGVATTIWEERGLGTLPFLLASPTRRMVLLMERALCNILDGLTTVILAFILGWLLFSVDFSETNFVSLGLAISVSALSTACFGMVVGVVAIPVRDVVALMGSAFVILLALTGVNFPVEALPSLLQIIAWALPLTRSITAARAAMDGAPVGEVLGELGMELAFGGVYWVLAATTVFIMERNVRRSGELEGI